MYNRAKYLPELAIASFNAGFPAEYFPAICSVESGFNPKTRSPVKASDEKYGGAWGLAQFTYDTAQGLGYKGAPEGLFDPLTTIGLLTRFTAQNAERFHISKADIKNLAACHNSGVPLAQIHDMNRLSKVVVYANRVIDAAQILRAECDAVLDLHKASQS
jgi:soluble lytic murein transglycosylase-like protein